jgi:nicotinamide mononucleotide transporter
VFFAIVSVYGWWRWSRRQQAQEAADGKAIEPRWASWPTRAGLVVAMLALTAVFTWVLGLLDSWNPLADAWILAGSILATYGMAKGWVEFWVIWIAVDAVGVPLLLKAHLYPSASMYIVYGGLCMYGIVSWARTRRRLERLSGTGPGEARPEPAALR